MQLFDSFKNGYWHARRLEFYTQGQSPIIEWLRLPGDTLFIVGGILPIVYLAIRMFKGRRRPDKMAAGEESEELTRFMSL